MIRDLFSELKRRNVFRVAVAYAIVAWLILQGSDVLVPLLQLPEWAGRFAFFVLLLGRRVQGKGLLSCLDSPESTLVLTSGTRVPRSNCLQLAVNLQPW